jgi:hypothetical protein
MDNGQWTSILGGQTHLGGQFLSMDNEPIFNQNKTCPTKKIFVQQKKILSRIKKFIVNLK